MTKQSEVEARLAKMEEDYPGFIEAVKSYYGPPPAPILLPAQGDEIQGVMEKLKIADAVLTGTVLARMADTQAAKLTVDLKAAAQKLLAALRVTPAPEKPDLRAWVQHKPMCRSLRCQFAYSETNRCSQPVDSSDHDSDIWPEHAFVAGDCTCELDAALAAQEKP